MKKQTFNFFLFLFSFFVAKIIFFDIRLLILPLYFVFYDKKEYIFLGVILNSFNFYEIMFLKDFLFFVMTIFFVEFELLLKKFNKYKIFIFTLFIYMIVIINDCYYFNMIKILKIIGVFSFECLFFKIIIFIENNINCLNRVVRFFKIR